MAERMSHTACFEHFDTKPRNVNWSWSARNEEKKTVVVTLWRDEFAKGPEGDLIYERGPVEPARSNKPGHKELMANLRFSVDECAGEVKVIIAVAVDPKADPRKIKDCRPTNMNAKVVALDERSGSFRIVASLKR
jgi:hypothetical protein